MTTTKTPASILISILLFVVVAAILLYIFKKEPVLAPVVDDTNTSVPGVTEQPTGNVADLVVVNLPPKNVISGIVTITGSLKGAYFFEATAQGHLLDANKNVFKSFMLSATSDWMTAEPVSFTGTVDSTGIPAGKGYVRLQNDNPSGDPINDKYIDIPVTFE